MAYIGYQPSYLATAPFAVNTFTGDGSTTTFTLSQAVPGANEAMVAVVVENVQQNPIDAYTISGDSNTSLVFSEAPISGAAIYVIHKGEGTYNLQPSTGSVTSTSLDPVLRNFTVDTFTGNGSTTTFTLTDTPYSANSIIVTVDGILQTATTNYSVSGTTLSFGTDFPANGAAITVLHLGFSTGNKSVADGTITPTKISSGGPSWTSAGNVGIGISTPTRTLDISATSATAFLVSSTGTNRAYYGASNTGGGVYLGRENSVGTSFNTTAYASVVWSEGAYPLVFATNNTERMRIDSSGNVGVGTTTTTTTRLNVTATSENVALFQNSNNSPALIRFREPATTTDPYIAAYGNAMAFGRYGSSETIRIDASGNVGIATASPSTYGKFAVVGDGYFSGNLGVGVIPTNKLHISATVNTVYSTTSTLAGGVLAYLKNASTTDSTDATIRLEATGSSGQAAPISISAVNTGSGAAALTFATRASTATDPLERMRIDSAGNVGIGATPLNKLTAAVVGNATLNTPAAHIAIFNSNDAVNNQYYGLAFTNSNSPEGGTQKPQALISCIATGGSWSSSWSADLVFSTASGGATAAPTEKLRIGSGGLLTLANGQIKFPATQVASADANTLDDYEEGTWTPTINSSGGSITSYTSDGTYTKIGRTVLVTARLVLTNVGTANGNLNVTNFPFTSAGTSMQMPMIVREGNVTGQIYQLFLNNASVLGTMQSLSGGGITWTNNYSYGLMGVYPASS
jgi:hypothetical protein